MTRQSAALSRFSAWPTNWLLSTVISLFSFALVIALTDYWRSHPALATGLWFALLVLPAYSSSLLTKLTDALARAEAANRAKSRFLATMSHELRTPLHAIIGMADLLRMSPLRSEQQDMVRTLRSAGQTLLEMIGTFVASADALEAVSQPYPAVTDDNPLMEHGLLSPRSQLKNHGMPLSLVRIETVPAWCPKCFAGGRPIAGLETLGAYTAVMWRDPGLVAGDERSRAVVGSNTYLRALFSTAAATNR